MKQILLNGISASSLDEFTSEQRQLISQFVMLTLDQGGNLEPEVMSYFNYEISEKYNGDFFKFIKESSLFKNVEQKDLMKFVYVTYLLACMEKPSVIGAEYISASPEGQLILYGLKKGWKKLVGTSLVILNYSRNHIFLIGEVQFWHRSSILV